MLWVDSDVATSAQTLTMIIGEGIVMAKALALHRNRRHLQVVLDTLQSDVDVGRNGKHFAWAQRVSNTMAIVNNVSFLVTSTAYLLLPVGIILVHLVGGSFTVAVLSWPYKCLCVVTSSSFYTYLDDWTIYCDISDCPSTYTRWPASSPATPSSSSSISTSSPRSWQWTVCSSDCACTPSPIWAI